MAAGDDAEDVSFGRPPAQPYPTAPSQGAPPPDRRGSHADLGSGGARGWRSPLVTGRSATRHRALRGCPFSTASEHRRAVELERREGRADGRVTGPPAGTCVAFASHRFPRVVPASQVAARPGIGAAAERGLPPRLRHRRSVERRAAQKLSRRAGISHSRTPHSTRRPPRHWPKRHLPTRSTSPKPQTATERATASPSRSTCPAASGDDADAVPFGHPLRSPTPPRPRSVTTIRPPRHQRRPRQRGSARVAKPPRTASERQRASRKNEGEAVFRQEDTLHPSLSWSCRELNPGPSPCQQDFSVRSPLCLSSSPTDHANKSV